MLIIQMDLMIFGGLKIYSNLKLAVDILYSNLDESIILHEK